MKRRRWWGTTGCLILLTALSGTAQTAAQEAETLFGGNTNNGGFGALIVKLTEVGDDFGVLVGARGGWIIDNTFVIGIGGYGLAHDDRYHGYQRTRGDLDVLKMGYGGLELEYVNRSHEVIHFSLQALVGGGGAFWDDRWGGDWDVYWEDIDPFFIFEPGANVMLNVVSFFRMGFGASYRFTDDVELQGLRPGHLDGWAGVLSFKFGKF